MFGVTLEGADALRERLDAFPTALRAELTSKSDALARALVDKVSEKLDGGVLNARSGALKASISARVTGAGDGVEARVGSFGGIKYAAIQEYGGLTAAHEILPSKGAALAFVVDGAMRFARRVDHPGSVIPERSYLRSSLEDMREEIVAALADSVGNFWGRS